MVQKEGNEKLFYSFLISEICKQKNSYWDLVVD